MRIHLVPAIILLTGLCVCCTGMAAETPWDGTWTHANYTLSMILNGTDISGIMDGNNPDLDGTYMLYGVVSDDGKILDGIISATGTAELTLSDNGMSVSGITSVEPLGSMTTPFVYPFNSTRNGTIADPNVRWEGVWESDFYRYKYSQDGKNISGTYQPISSPLPINGFIQGNVSEDGNNLSLQWVYTERVIFSLSEDGTLLNQTNCDVGALSDEETCLNLVKAT